MIPKKLHQVWLGDEPQPSRFLRWSAEFRRLHPSWECRLWTDADCERELPDLWPLMEQCSKQSSRANVARLGIVFRHGGVYADTDVEPLKPFDPLLDCSAFVGRESVGGVYCNAVFGAVPAHPWIGEQIERLPEFVGRKPPWGPRLMTDTMDGHDVVRLPPKTFYPVLWNQRHKLHEPQADSYCVHHWTISWNPRLSHLRKEDVAFANRRELYRSLPRGGVGMEVGVFLGDNARDLCELAKPRVLHLVDPWVSQDIPNWKQVSYAEHLANMRRVQTRFTKEIGAGRVVLHQGFSGIVLETFRDASLDWVYLDGDHRLDAVLCDLRECSRLLKPDGLLMGHDFVSGEQSAWAKRGRYGVVEAVHRFCAETDWRLESVTGELDLTKNVHPSFLLRRKPK